MENWPRNNIFEENIELRDIKEENEELSDRIMLMEVPEDICEFLSGQKRGYLTLKSSYDGNNTVLCTSSKTYLLRNVTQTNSLLLFQRENEGFSLLKDAKSYLEIVSMPIRIDLEHLSYIYDGYNLDVPDNTQVYTLCQVKRRTPASDEEIENAFIYFMCLFINGYLRRLSFDYAFHILQLILAYAQEEDIPLDSLKFDSLMSNIGSDEREDVVKLVLRRFSKTKTEPYAIDGHSIAQWIGIHLLSKHKSTPISYNEFIEKWRSTIPEPFSALTELSLLEGQYLLIEPSMIQYFPEDILPMDPAMRFRELFLVRPKWNLSDILPYIRGLATDETKVDSLLRKFTRKQTLNQQTIVIARNTWK
ncbi:hypothetical protein T552_02654 [Pneumocystis carinii B80]|uniref:Sister chromatid cohesion protein DCC1 n=1 Tax=Pneumocystis carinii (strain B80) TaxID=1408658 RepID=A0A0W4ZE56_PNEC8|nr:hypothetical protein T552_02654 [Pneumocystis carinii B80]KTW26645.1 hypothetical protein T552_02654 [Pneumocystis carinii B80]